MRNHRSATKWKRIRTAAVGRAGFGGVMLVLIGIVDLIQGLVAVVDDEFSVISQEWVVEFGVTAGAGST